MAVAVAVGVGAAVDVCAVGPADAGNGLGSADGAGPGPELVQAAMMSGKVIVCAISRGQICLTPRALPPSVVRIDDNLDSGCVWRWGSLVGDIYRYRDEGVLGDR
ncbi:hypothetical protein BH23CHL7_BH23CHL7_19520 [soil metagenome]